MINQKGGERSPITNSDRNRAFRKISLQRKSKFLWRSSFDESQKLLALEISIKLFMNELKLKQVKVSIR